MYAAEALVSFGGRNFISSGFEVLLAVATKGMVVCAYEFRVWVLIHVGESRSVQGC